MNKHNVTSNEKSKATKKPQLPQLLESELRSIVWRFMGDVMPEGANPLQGLNVGNICSCVHNTTYVIGVRQFYSLNKAAETTITVEKGDFEGLQILFGKFLKIDDVTQSFLLSSAAAKGKKNTDAYMKKFAEDVMSAIELHIKICRQATASNLYVDMFATEPRMTLDGKTVSVYFTHKPLPEGALDETVWKDYQEHFKGFKEYLDLMVSARFAPDRKKAHIFMRMPSDFGKGLLLGKGGIMDSLGLVTELSLQEFEKCIAAQNTGRYVEEFLGAFALVINECRRITYDHLKAESYIPVTGKFLMTQYVAVYLKCYTSADFIAGLTGEDGVDPQIANRFELSDQHEAGSIDNRPLYQADPHHYREALRNHIAAYINWRVMEYQALGSEGASKLAEARLNESHKKNGLANAFGVITDNADQLQNDFQHFAWGVICEIPSGKAIQYQYRKVSNGIALQSISSWLRAFAASKSGDKMEQQVMINRLRILYPAKTIRYGIGKHEVVKGALIDELPASYKRQPSMFHPEPAANM